MRLKMEIAKKIKDTETAQLFFKQFAQGQTGRVSVRAEAMDNVTDVDWVLNALSCVTKKMKCRIEFLKLLKNTRRLCPVFMQVAKNNRFPAEWRAMAIDRLPDLDCLKEVVEKSDNAYSLLKIANLLVKLSFAAYIVEEVVRKWEIAVEISNIKILEKITDQRVLADIVKFNSKSVKYSVSVIDRIEDQKILKKLILSLEDGILCETIFKKLKHQSAIQAGAFHILANTNANKEIKTKVLANLTDQRKLNSLLKKVSNLELRFAIAKKIKDEEVRLSIFKEIASNDSVETTIRLRAVRLINEQGDLLELAQNVDESSIRLEIAKNLQETKTKKLIFKEVVLDETERLARRLNALQQIEDQRILSGMLHRVEHPQIRFEIAKKIKNKKNTGFIFKEVVLDKSFKCSFRLEAVQQIDDQRILSGLVRRVEDPQLLFEIAEKLKNKRRAQSVFEKIGKATTNPLELRLKAIRLIEDQSVLASFVINDDYQEIYHAAISSITKPEILIDIVWSDIGLESRCWAMRRINDQSILANIVKEEYPLDICCAAIECITDWEIIEDLLTSIKNATILEKIETVICTPSNVIAIEAEKRQELLTYLAKTGKNFDVALKSVRQIKEFAILHSIAYGKGLWREEIRDEAKRILRRAGY